jgi:phosphatidylglycerophosphate synthase
MLNPPHRAILVSPFDRAAESMGRLGIGANAITIFGFLMGLTAAAWIADEQYFLGLSFLVLNRIADGLDGALARRTRVTALGAFLDASLDLFVYATIPFAFALTHQQDALAMTFLLLCLIVASIPALAALGVSGLRIRPPGALALLEHGQVFVAFALMCIMPRWTFSLVAYFFGVVFFVSGALRMIFAIASLRGTAKP